MEKLPPTQQELRAFTALSVAQAAKAWANAPLHFKGLAGAYVGPLMQALQAMEAERANADHQAQLIAVILRDLAKKSDPDTQQIIENFTKGWAAP